MWTHCLFWEGIHFTLELLDSVVMIVCQLLGIVSHWLKYRVYGWGEAAHALNFDSYPVPALPQGTHPGCISCLPWGMGSPLIGIFSSFIDT